MRRRPRPTGALSRQERKKKVRPITCHEGVDMDQMYSSTLSLTSALDSGGWLTPRAGRFTPGNEAVPTVQEAGWAPRLVMTGEKNIALAAIRSPCRPVRRQSLYWQSHPGPHHYYYYYHQHHHWVVAVVVVFLKVCGDNVRDIYEHWKWHFLYLSLKYYLHWCTSHNLANFVQPGDGTAKSQNI